MQGVLVRPQVRLLLQAAVLLAAGWVVWTMLGRLERLEWGLLDMDAYWNAAMRLRSGAELYDSGSVGPQVYRYAPWFAYLWVPLTYLPRGIVDIAWSGVLILSALLSALPLLRTRDFAPVGVVMAVVLVYLAGYGNVQALMMLPLIYWMDRRWLGPVGIALAASLKLSPILLVVVYVARREWMRAAATLALTAVLVAPMLAFDLSQYPTSNASASLLFLAPWAYVPIALAAIGGTAWLAYRRSPMTWTVAGLMLVLSAPKLSWYESTYLLTGAGSLALDRSEEVRTEGVGVRGSSRT